MKGLRDLLTKLGTDQGIQIDPEELDALGLPDEDETSIVSLDLPPLPGTAAGVVELFLAAPDKAIEEGDLLWEPIAREGQWALRPDGKGGKKRVPLKIVAGRSKNQRREIGLQDVVDAFDDGAVEHVTVPETHENKATENNGYIKGLKIVAGKVSGKPVKFLMGGYEITEPAVKEKMRRGSIPSRSAGFLYDYERTDTGKRYPVALEHVALTPRPWLRGMPRFGRKLEACSDLDVVTVTLSDDGPSDEEYTLSLADADPEEDFLADAAVTWSHEDDPKWLQQQVNSILSAKRAERYAAARAKRKDGVISYIEDRLPNYRCESVKPGFALVCDGWGEDANYWVAGISIVDGLVVMDEFSKWKSTKKVWVADEREQPKGDKTPLAEDQVTIEVKTPTQTVDPLQFAQELRRSRATKNDTTNEPPRGGGNMAGEATQFQLSDEARAEFKKLEDALTAERTKNEKLSQTVDKLVGTANSQSADTFIGELKAMGLTEERGFTGLLNEVHQVLLADDGGPALQSDHFADDKNTTGELTLSEAFRRVFGALRTAEGSTLKLGEVITPPSETKDGDKLGSDGKPPKDDEGEDLTNLSDAEILAKEDPEVLAKMGIKLSATSNGGEQS